MQQETSKQTTESNPKTLESSTSSSGKAGSQSPQIGWKAAQRSLKTPVLSSVGWALKISKGTQHTWNSDPCFAGLWKSSATMYSKDLVPWKQL